MICNHTHWRKYLNYFKMENQFSVWPTFRASNSAIFTFLPHFFRGQSFAENNVFSENKTLHVFILCVVSVARPFGAQLLVFFCPSCPVVLFYTPGISRFWQYVVAVRISESLYVLSVILLFPVMIRYNYYNYLYCAVAFSYHLIILNLEMKQIL